MFYAPCSMNLVILGPQGSGKGTQADLLIKKYGLSHIDIGLALRNVAKAATPLGEKINDIINVKKELVSDAVIAEVLEHELSQIPPKAGVILDGAPRRMGQIDEVENAFKKNGRRIDKVIHVHIPETESVIRISKRFNCSKCQSHLILGKDVHNADEPCPSCGGKIEQRPDDTVAGVRKRLHVYRDETLPVIEYYLKAKKLVEVDGLHRVEEVFQEIVAKLEK